MNELQVIAPAGSAVYAVLRNPNAQPWNTSSSAFETWSDAHYGSYAISLAYQGGQTPKKFWTADFPAVSADAGAYSVEYFTQVGESPSETADAFLCGGVIQWAGSPDSSLPVQLASMLTSLCDVKDFLNITVTDYDTYLTNRIIAATGAVQRYCRRKFWLQNITETLDGPGSTTRLLGHYPVLSVTQVTVGNGYTTPQVISGSDIWVKEDGTIGIVVDSQSPVGWFQYGDQSVVAEYVAGYAQIPAEIQEAVAIIVRNQYLLRGADATMHGEKIGDYQYVRRNLTYIPVEATALLYPFRQNVV
jgi:hypothetical protein